MEKASMRKIVCVVITGLFFIIYSCNNESKTKKTDSDTTAITDTTRNTDTTNRGQVRINSERDQCITITRDQIYTNWTNTLPGWNDETNDNYISILYVLPFRDMTGGINAIAYPSNKAGKLLSNKPIVCAIKELNPPCDFIPDAVLRITKLENFGQIFSESGQLLTFDYLRLRPEIFVDNSTGVAITTMQFVLESVVKAETREIIIERGMIKPSPPAKQSLVKEYEKLIKDSVLLKKLRGDIKK